ncbi:MAG: GpE family phage tail protein [Piscinibacter sp.]|nr:GpE family phage tail protein [Piscinibacter sp.]
MAETAGVLHWSLESLESLQIPELIAWHQEAVELEKRRNGEP